MRQSQLQGESAVSVREEFPASLLSERAMTALRTAIQGQFRHQTADHSLRRALRALCVEARAKELRAEQLILIFKRVWHSLPESRGGEARKRQNLLDRLITICVEEYYAT